MSSDVIGVLGVVAGGMGALGGVGAWIVAARANGRADRANTLAEAANATAGEALELQRTALPPAWSSVEFPADNRMAFRNQSGRPIIVVSIEVEPDAAAPFIEARPRPFRVDYGDLLAIGVKPRYTAQPAHDVIIGWRYEGEDGVQRTSRQV